MVLNIINANEKKNQQNIKEVFKMLNLSYPIKPNFNLSIILIP